MNQSRSTTANMYSLRVPLALDDLSTNTLLNCGNHEYQTIGEREFWRTSNAMPKSAILTPLATRRTVIQQMVTSGQSQEVEKLPSTNSLLACLMSPCMMLFAWRKARPVAVWWRIIHRVPSATYVLQTSVRSVGMESNDAGGQTAACGHVTYGLVTISFLQSYDLKEDTNCQLFARRWLPTMVRNTHPKVALRAQLQNNDVLQMRVRKPMWTLAHEWRWCSADYIPGSCRKRIWGEPLRDSWFGRLWIPSWIRETPAPVSKDRAKSSVML